MSSVEIPAGNKATLGRAVEEDEDEDDDPFNAAVVVVSASLSETSVDALPTDAG